MKNVPVHKLDYPAKDIECVVGNNKRRRHEICVGAVRSAVMRVASGGSRSGFMKTANV